MEWWEYLNPFEYLGTAAGQVAADAWTTAMLGLWNAGLWLLRLVLMLEDFLLTPDLSADGPMREAYQVTFWIAGVFALVLVMIQLGIAAIRRDGQSLARVLLGTGQFVIVWAAWIVYAVAVLAAAGGLSKALMRSLLGVEWLSAWQPWSGFGTADIADGTIATVLGIMGLFLVFAAVAHLLVMLTRAAALLILAATNPIAAAGLMWEGGRAWFWKAFRWFHAAAFTPVIMVLVLGLGVQITSNVALSMADSLEAAIGTAVPGVFLILVGAFAPLALFKLLAFVDPGTSSGAAMRTGLAAQGGIQGLLAGGSGSGGSNAASTADAGGTSAGEAGAEAATSQRAANSTGALAAALGPVGAALGTGLSMTVAAGTAAATIGADLSNQMGVGHNTYIPDTPASRNTASRSAGGSGPSHNHPDINGSGDPDSAGGDDSQQCATRPSASPPAPTPPVSPPTPTAGIGTPAGTAGPTGSGPGASGGAAGATGAAGAVPPV